MMCCVRDVLCYLHLQLRIVNLLPSWSVWINENCPEKTSLNFSTLKLKFKSPNSRKVRFLPNSRKSPTNWLRRIEWQICVLMVICDNVRWLASVCLRTSKLPLLMFLSESWSRQGNDVDNNCETVFGQVQPMARLRRRSCVVKFGMSESFAIVSLSMWIHLRFDISSRCEKPTTSSDDSLTVRRLGKFSRRFSTNTLTLAASGSRMSSVIRWLSRKQSISRSGNLSSIVSCSSFSLLNWLSLVIMSNFPAFIVSAFSSFSRAQISTNKSSSIVSCTFKHSRFLCWLRNTFKAFALLANRRYRSWRRLSDSASAFCGSKFKCRMFRCRSKISLSSSFEGSASLRILVNESLVRMLCGNSKINLAFSTLHVKLRTRVRWAMLGEISCDFLMRLTSTVTSSRHGSKLSSVNKSRSVSAAYLNDIVLM